MIEQFESMLANGRDDALLRYSLGQAYLQKEQFDAAVEHLRAALEHDPNYSAAWRALGQSLAGALQLTQAREAYRKGIEVADRNGDKQAARQMQVFARRLGNAKQ